MKRLRSASGKTSMVTMILIVAVVVGAYLGWHYLPLFFDDFDVKHAMREAAARAYTEPDDGKVKEKLLKAIANVPTNMGGGTKWEGVIDMETVEVTLERKANQHIDVWVSYVRPIDWLFIKRRTWIRFNKHVEGDLSPVVWGKPVGGE